MIGAIKLVETYFSDVIEDIEPRRLTYHRSKVTSVNYDLCSGNSHMIIQMDSLEQFRGFAGKVELRGYAGDSRPFISRWLDFKRDFNIQSPDDLVQRVVLAAYDTKLIVGIRPS